MAIGNVDLESLSANELGELIRRAREIKSKKATPSIKINGYVTSVGKHVSATLEAIKKLSLAEGVSARKWEEVEASLGRLQLANYRTEADKVKLTPRTARGGGRRRK